MTRIELTPVQQKDLIMALMFGAPGQLDLEMVKLESYEPAYRSMETAHHAMRYTLSIRKDVSYTLSISYFSEGTGRNPQLIDIFELGGVSPRRVELRGLGYVVDKLREYGVW